MTRKFTKEEFISACLDVHGDTYDYSLVEYTGNSKKVAIICKTHGIFHQQAVSHKSGSGCALCASDAPISTDEFISRSNKVHGNFYDYSNTRYLNGKTKVEIICPLHGPFHQLGQSHLKGAGCSKCARIKQSKKISLTQEGFLERCHKVHGDKYDYSETVYIADNQEVKIICPIHGAFYQLAGPHSRRSGCVKCANAKAKVDQSYTQEEFIAKSRAVHFDKYDYSLSVYTATRDSVDVICPIHGLFTHNAGEHMRGTGCPECNAGGYRQNKRGSVYILQNGPLTKVGITNVAVHRRANIISKSYGQPFEVITYLTFQDGRIPLAVETQIHKELRKHYEQPTEKFDGYTECFLNVDVGSLITRIGQIAGEQFNQLNKE